MKEFIRKFYEYAEPLGGNPSQTKELLEVKNVDDKVEVIYKVSTPYWGGLSLPSITKEIIQLVDGKMQVVKTVQGKYIPPQAERYEFRDDRFDVAVLVDFGEGNGKCLAEIKHDTKLNRIQVHIRIANMHGGMIDKAEWIRDNNRSGSAVVHAQTPSIRIGTYLDVYAENGQLIGKCGDPIIERGLSECILSYITIEEFKPKANHNGQSE